jgi:ABC-2 type transport system permease protein
LKFFAFIKKDILVTLSYRFKLVLGVGGILATLLFFYFIGKTFSGAISPYLEEYGNDYFSYVLVGIATSNFVTLGLSALANQIRSAQVEGTLEYLLATPTSIYTILIGNTLWSFISAFFTAAAILFLGAVFLHFRVSLNAAFVSLLILLLTFLAFLVVGMLSASFVIIFKRGNPIEYLLGWSSFFLGSVIFPVEVLPRLFQIAAQFLPITHAVQALRKLLLAESTPTEILPSLVKLCIFIVILAPFSTLFLHYSVNRAKRDGNLSQY